MPYLLDTDTASLAFNGNERVIARIRQAKPQNISLSSISAEESIRGAFKIIHRTQATAGLPDAHSFFTRLLSFLYEYHIHAYNDEAALVYGSFPASITRIGTQDCRIAASAIAAGWIVVTANTRHFSQIPGVQFEDWSR